MPKDAAFFCAVFCRKRLDRDHEMLYILVNEIYNTKSRISKSGRKVDTMKKQYDVVIIGAGVVGSAIARELSRYKLSIAVLEKKSGCLQRDQWPQLCGGARRLCQPHWQPESEVLRRRQPHHGSAGRRAELPVQALRQGAGGQHPRGHGAAGAHHEAGRCQRLHRP